MAEAKPASAVIQVPAWEHEYGPKEANGSHTPATRTTWRNRFDAMLPPHRRYLGLGRKWFLVAVCAASLCLLALIIGLAAGLSHRTKNEDLPLPSNSQHFTGDLTYYGPGLGACGVTSTSSDHIVSVSHIIFDAASTGSDPNNNPLCGRKIRAQRFDSSVGQTRSVDLTVVDRCVGCKASDLDTTLGVFDTMAVEAQGRVDVTWAWLAPAATATAVP